MSRGGAKRILLVDDQADNRNLVRQICEWLGYQLTEAVNGEEAIRFARADLPDLILMDLELPELDGWAATVEIKANPATQGIPVIAVSAHVMPGERARALAAGCDDYVAKPISLEPFRELLGRYLGSGGAGR